MPPEKETDRRNKPNKTTPVIFKDLRFFMYWPKFVGLSLCIKNYLSSIFFYIVLDLLCHNLTIRIFVLTNKINKFTILRYGLTSLNLKSNIKAKENNKTKTQHNKGIMSEIDSKSTAGIAEWADKAPPQDGEYIYNNGISSVLLYSVSGKLARQLEKNPICFVCERNYGRARNCLYIEGITQCTDAARRITAMFKPGSADYVLDPDCKEGACVIAVCEEHKHHAKILCDLTTDGIITPERVSRAKKALISRAEFNNLVREKARQIWGNLHDWRTRENWYDAFKICCNKLGHIPSPSQRAEQAYQLWLQKKDDQAKEDWLSAEKQVLALYTVDES